MISRSLKILHVAMWLIAMTLSFMLVSARDAEAPLSSSATVTVTSWSGAESVATFRQSLRMFAQSRHLTVGQDVPDFQKRNSIRVLYLLANDPGVPVAQRSLARGTLDGFGGSVTTVVRPFSEVTTSPLGDYAVFGDQAKVRLLQNFFAEHGMASDIVLLSRWGQVSNSVRSLAVIGALLGVSLAGAFVVSRTRRYAIERLHGLSWWSIFLTDVAPSIKIWVVGGSATISMASIAAKLAFGTAGIVLFVQASALISFTLLFVTVVSHAVVLAMVAAVEILPGLKGSLPSRALIFVAYGIRLTSVAVALGAMTTTLALVGDVVERNNTQHALDRSENMYSVTLGNAYSLEDMRRMDAAVGPWLRQCDQNHQIVMAAQSVLSTPDPLWQRSPVLSVNDNFLLRQSVHLKDGNIMRPSMTGAIRIAVPSDRWTARNRLLPHLGLNEFLPQIRHPRIEWMQAEPGQSYSTFTPVPVVNDASWNTTRSVVRNPVVILLPSRFGWPSDESYASVASQGGVLFKNPVVVTEAVKNNPRLERFVRGVSPVSALAAALLIEQVKDLRAAAFTAALAVAIIVMTGVAAALIHTRRRAQSALIRHVHGWSFASMYTALLAVEGCISLGVLAWIPWRVASARQEYDKLASIGPMSVSPPAMTPAELAGMVLISGIALGAFWVALVMAHRQVVRGGVSQA